MTADLKSRCATYTVLFSYALHRLIPDVRLAQHSTERMRDWRCSATVDTGVSGGSSQRCYKHDSVLELLTFLAEVRRCTGDCDEDSRSMLWVVDSKEEMSGC